MKIIRIVFYTLALLFFVNSVENVLKVYVFQTAEWWEIYGALNNLMLIGLVVVIFIFKAVFRSIHK
jgi:hypothetical protein